MSVKAQFQVIDRGFNRIVRQLKELDTSELDVGLFEDTQSADGKMTMGGLGIVQELGRYSDMGRVEITEIPPRPFTENTAIERQDEICDVMEVEVDKLVFKAKNPKSVLSAIGRKYASFVKQTIIDFYDPENAEATIDWKGFNDPLMHTGTMKNSVKHKISRKL